MLCNVNDLLVFVPGGKSEPFDSSPHVTLRRELYEETGHMVYHYKEIRTRYLRGWFTIDVVSIAASSTDIIGTLHNVNNDACDSTTSNAASRLRALRML